MTFFNSSSSYTLPLKGCKIYGFSVRNNSTFVIIPKMKVGFDIGNWVHEHENVDHLIISSLRKERIGGLREFLLKKSEKGCNIYISEESRTILLDEIQLLQKKYQQNLTSPKIQIIGVEENVLVSISKTLSAKNISKGGWTIIESRSKMKQEFLEEFKKVKDKRKYIEEKGRENLFFSKESILWSYFVAENKEKVPREMFETCEYLITTVPSFMNNMEFREENDDDFSKMMVDLRDHFPNGKGIIFCDLEDYLCLSGNIHYFFFLLPRIPKSIVEKVTLLPYSDLVRFKKQKSYLTDFQIDYERVRKVRETFPEYHIMKKYEPEDYEFRQHLGYAGSRKYKMKQELVKKYGDEYIKVYLWKDEESGKDVFVDRDYALFLYEESYYNFLKKHRRIYEYIISEGFDVYDTEKENIYSGYDYHKQDSKKATHLQDIAVRRVVKRLGGKFKGNRLLRIRGIDSELYCLNPGFVEFVKKDWVCRDHLFVRDWTLDGSVECFWQSNKVILTKKEK